MAVICRLANAFDLGSRFSLFSVSRRIDHLLFWPFDVLKSPVFSIFLLTNWFVHYPYCVVGFSVSLVYHSPACLPLKLWRMATTRCLRTNARFTTGKYVCGVTTDKTSTLLETGFAGFFFFTTLPTMFYHQAESYESSSYRHAGPRRRDCEKFDIVRRLFYNA